MSLNFLAFDTATEWCSAALWRDGACTARAEHAGQRHSEMLVPMLRALLDEAGMDFPDLDALVYGMGPGSFTGLRIACGVAQGLALAADLPVLGVNTLEALAEQSGAARVVACLDARMREVYAGIYQRGDDGWRCLSGPLVCRPDAVPLPPGSGYLGVGSGFAAYAELARTLDGCLDDVDGACIPHARAMARLALPRLARGEARPAEHAEPLYVRDKVALKTCERAGAA